jgi:5-(aminomethyl)-3-furanmethanol phosphate kinase
MTGHAMTSHALRARAEAASPAEQSKPIIVKLGGSVVRSPDLSSWLDAIAAARAPIVVVPGGGALADEVRACQASLGFSDPAAHRMALLAMDQLAWAVAGLRSGVVVGATEAELRGALERGQVAVWAPYALIAERTDIETSWRMTSDSLALWLAGQLGARRCYLIKAIARRPQASASAAQLARDGIVDAAFPSMLSEVGVPAVLLGRGDQAGFAAALSGTKPYGAAID